jgi:predicted enzyme related to lactoylglutathione lyase
MAVGRFLAVTIDAIDPQALAPFWMAVLGTEVDEEVDDGRYVFLAGHEGLPSVCLQRVPERRSTKNRVHLDLEVDDLEVATARIAELGGTWDGEHRVFERFRWRTMFDPEGNEFDINLEE